MIRPGPLALVAAVAALGLGVVLPGAACHGPARDAGPPCSAVAARFLDIARTDLARAAQDGVDGPTRRAVEDQLPAMRDSLTQVCAGGRWSAEVRGCLVAASNHVDFEACEQRLTDDQRRDLDRANRGATGSGP